LLIAAASGLAEEAAPPGHHLLLKQLRQRQIASRGQGDGRLSDRL
jgi:hypothetical protein